MNPGLVVKLRPTGPWRIGPDSGARNRVDTIYHSDSLYSAVSSAMARLGRLEEWLDATARRGGEAAVRFSSCFPFLQELGFVVPPRTLWPPASPAQMGARVRWRSARFVPLPIVQALLAGQVPDENHWTVDGMSECLVPAGRPGPFRTSVRWSAAVDRLTGATERHSMACIEFREGAGWWTAVWFADEETYRQWSAPVKTAFRLLADSGFGGERSRGWGRAAEPEFIEGTLPDLILPPAPAKEAEASAELAAPPVTAALRVAPEPPAPPVAPPETEAGSGGQADEPAQPGADSAGSDTPGETAQPGAEAAAGSAVQGENAAAGSPAPGEPAHPGAEAEAGSAVQGKNAAAGSPAPGEPAQPGAEAEAGSAGQAEGAVAGSPVPGEPAQPGAGPAAGSAGQEESAAVGSDAPGEPAQSDLVSAAGSAGQEQGTSGSYTPGESEQPGAEAAAGGAVQEPGPSSSQAPGESAQPGAEPIARGSGPEELVPPAAGSDAPVGSLQPSAEIPARAEAPPGGPTPTGTAEPALAGAEKLPPPAAVPREEPPGRPAAPTHAHWLLSLFTPAPGDGVDWTRGNYAVMARGGRIESPAGSGGLKKQIHMVTEGSVLYAAESLRGVAADVAPDGFAHPVFRSGFALAIPLPGEVS